MRTLPALVLGCTLLLPARAAAQDAAPTPPPTAGQISAARELLEVMHLAEVSAVAVKVALDEQIRANPQLEPFRAAMIAWGTEIFASEEAKTAYATLYAGAFSEADLRQLVAFYRSPLGQRLANSQVTLAARGAEIGRALATSHQADLMARLQRIAPQP
ncbi:MAG TPA: DUF2059 domain-containing protein [Longimicrobium sp.]|jgi:hypothetical protein|nr:DUF2059 domain-containing protein [Longimicrobium sp.]